MKGALACPAEAARAVAGASFPGELVIVATGSARVALGRGEDLSAPRRERLHRRLGRRRRARRLDPAGPARRLRDVELTIRRDGAVTHELMTAAGTPNPNLVAARVIEAIRARNEELATIEHEWVGPERTSSARCTAATSTTAIPVECRLVGTRRWAPGNTFAQAETEFRALLEPIAAESGCAIDLDLPVSRGAYRIDPEHGSSSRSARRITT